MKKILLFSLLLTSCNVFAGGGGSKLLIGAAAGIFTGGVSFALGATAAAATAAGATAAIGISTGGNTRVGANFDGNGNCRGMDVDVRSGNGTHIAHISTDNSSTFAPPRQGVSHNWADEQRRREESLRAQVSFSNWTPRTIFDIQFVNGQEYHRAKNDCSEFLTPAVSRGWEKSNKPIERYSTFVNQPYNLKFEETPLIWHFSIETIGGRRYNHAWSDTMLDFMVPEGEHHTICAPDWYIREVLEDRQRNAALDCVTANSQKKTQKENAAKGLIQEAFWGALDADRAINQQDIRRARDCATTAVRLYEKALEVLRPIGCFVDDVVEEIAIPGGAENLRKFQKGQISHSQYVANVNADLATDATASLLGSFIGGSTGGFAGAVAGGPAGAALGANAGSIKGAVAGYVASRATKAVARASVSFFKGLGGNEKQRVTAVKQDADNYINGIREKGVLSKKGRTLDGFDYFKVEKKCEYMGQKLRKGDYLSRDTLHHEWELFRGPKNHQGAIDPLTGKLNVEKRDTSRILRIP